MPIVEDFLINLAAGFTQTLLMALGKRVLGDPQQRALKRAYQAGFEAMLRTAGSGLSQAELAVVGDVIGRFLGQPAVATALLDLGLVGAPLDVSALAARWNDASGPADLVNIRFDFGWGLLSFQQSLTTALINEASRPESPLANQVVVTRLVALQGQVGQILDLLQAGPPAAPPAGAPTPTAPAPIGPNEPPPAAPPPAVPATHTAGRQPSATDAQPEPAALYHSCFISYASKDQAFADRLYADLRAAGVTCWYAPEDMAIGDRIRKTIYAAIGRLDKLLIILSRNSIASDWVEGEVERAFERERRQNDTILFPIRLDDDVMTTDEAWAGDIRRTRHIGDFTRWFDPLAYQTALRRVLRDLRVDRSDDLSSTDDVASRPFLDSLPEPGPLPPGSRSRYARNNLFTGRQVDLQALARILLHDDGKAVITQATAITGWGGVGKTQLAVEFAYRYGRFFPGGVFWLNGASEDSLIIDLVDCGLAMGLRPWPEKQSQQVATVLRAWQMPPARLAILDNLEDPTRVRAWLARLGFHVRVLLTARRSRWPAGLGLTCHSLDALARPESLALLRLLAPRLAQFPDAALDPVPARLGDLPLALDLVGRYLAEREDLTPAAYLAELDAARHTLAHTSLLDWTDQADNPTEHETSLAATFLLSWRRLKVGNPIDALATRCLRAAACCAPNTPIPRPLFYALAEDARTVDRALRRLTELGLLASSPAGLVIHPLLAEFGLTVEPAVPSPLPDVASALADLARAANRTMDHTGSAAAFFLLRPHVNAVVEHARNDAPIPTASLWNGLGYHLHRLADYPGARAAFDQALVIRKHTLGLSHPDTAESLNNLGVLLKTMGELVPAESCHEQALAIFRETLGPDHPSTAQSLNNLGALLYAMGDLTGAKSYYEQALAIRQQMLEPIHPDIAESLNNLGALLYAMGDLTGAKSYYEQALAIRQQMLEPIHPDTGGTLNNLGVLLQAMGDLAGAQSHLEQALVIFRETLGPNHLYTARSLSRLGALRKTLGDLAEAKLYYEQALAIFRAALGPDHPSTVAAQADLAYLNQTQAGGRSQ